MYIFYMFHFKWYGENSCPSNDSREFLHLYAKVEFCGHATNPIRFICAYIILDERECVFLCRSIYKSSILLWFLSIFCLTSAFFALYLSLSRFTSNGFGTHFEWWSFWFIQFHSTFCKRKIFDFCTHRLNQRVKHWTIKHASAWVCAIYVILVVICTFACLNIQIGFTIHVFYFWLSPHLKTKPKKNHR